MEGISYNHMYSFGADLPLIALGVIFALSYISFDTSFYLKILVNMIK